MIQIKEDDTHVHRFPSVKIGHVLEPSFKFIPVVSPGQFVRVGHDFQLALEIVDHQDGKDNGGKCDDKADEKVFDKCGFNGFKSKGFILFHQKIPVQFMDKPAG